MNRFSLLILASLLIGGCSSKQAPESAEQKPAGVIPQAQLDALNKAKAVEGVIEQGAQRERDQIDKQNQ